MTLTEAPLGIPVTIDEATLDHQVRFRLSELGIRPGKCTSVLHRSALSGTVLSCEGQRLALDAATARSVKVKLTGQES